ncbi:MAG: tRNA-intron lyase [Candidatus Pacearchaeota archaeon]|jgi:tRNA-intron endonuclease
MKDSKFQIFIFSDKIYSNSEKAFSFESTKNLGEKKDGKIIYSPFEAYYLIDKNKAILIKNNKELSFEESLNILIKSVKDFLTKYAVFKKLKERGYLVKTGSKFGSEFRVYENNLNKHAKWILYIVKKTEKISTEELISKTRISHSTAKKLLIAIVDSEDNILFYETDWIKI